MEELIAIYQRLIANTKIEYQRYLYHEIDWTLRLIGITGSRGTGKTTLMLQHIKMNIKDKSQALFVSLDNLWFSTHTLSELTNQFYTFGGKYLFIDEVHRYPNWAIEIKNIYDSYPDLYIAFTGSSMLEIYKSNADLSRRVITYHLPGLSFREYLSFERVLKHPAVSLEQLIQNHQQISMEITEKVKILPFFLKYLETGYYPFYKESIKMYPIRLQNIVNAVLDSDLPAVESIDYSSILKIKRLLGIVASLVPFTPNLAKLSTELSISRGYLSNYLTYLHKAGIITLLHSSAKGMSLLNKPDKIYLNNPSLLYALSDSRINEGNKRETFFISQLSVNQKVTSSTQTDFLVNERYSFEVGGSGKGYNQIKDLKDSFIAADNIEVGFGNKIPLWLFGFIY